MLDSIQNTIRGSARTLLVGAAVFAVVVGCEPAKELPKPEERTAQTNTRTILADPRGKAPAASDPKAKEIVDLAIKAMCNNTPEVFAKTKVSSASMKGKVNCKNLGFQESTRLIQAVWPNQALVTLTIHHPAIGKQLMGFQSEFGWVVPANIAQGLTPEGLAAVFADDVVAEHWMLLGFPFLDSSAVFFDLKPDSGSKRSTLKVALPGRTVYEVTFSDDTHLIQSIAYDPLEADRRSRVSKQVFPHDYRSEGGLQLPTRLTTAQSRETSAEWTYEKWEFPAKLDDSLFSPPK
jgi:hypothetical protein